MAPATIGFTELLKKRNRAKLSYVYSIFSTGMPNLVIKKLSLVNSDRHRKGLEKRRGGKKVLPPYKKKSRGQ